MPELLIRRGKAADVYFAEETDPEEIAERIAVKNHIGLMDWGDPRTMIYVMMGNGLEGKVAQRMNEVKGRPPDQVLAISGFAGLVDKVGILSRSKVLMEASEQHQLTPQELINRIFEFPVGVVVPAREDLPNWITTTKGGEKKVMVAGQIRNPNLEYADLYNQVVEILDSKYNTFCAASSGNRSDLDVYTVYQQEVAYRDFRHDVDFFVMRGDVNPRFRNYPMTSCTAFDLGDGATLKRWGSRDVRRFRGYLPGIDVSHKVQILPGAEILFSSIFDTELHPHLRWRLFLESMKKVQLKKAS